MPNLVVLAGPNGAGKSTAAPKLLHEFLGIEEFVNADVIARGLSAFNPEGAAIEAGRIMLRRLRELAARRVDFAFETTLAGRGFAPWIAELVESEYVFHLFYLWVPDPEMCVARVARRVLAGGHNIPEDIVRRRYAGGLRNFFQLYRPLAGTWELIDNSLSGHMRLIAAGGRGQPPWVYDESAWSRLLREYGGADREQA